VDLATEVATAPDVVLVAAMDEQEGVEEEALRTLAMVRVELAAATLARCRLFLL
jgi:hypothetical protein